MANKKIVRSFRPLSRLAEALIVIFNGNIADAARQLKCSTAQVNEMISNPKVMKELRKRWKEEFSDLAADRSERILFFTSVMRDPNVKTSERMKAAEELGKLEGDYVTVKKVVGDPDNPIKVEHTRGVEERIENLAKQLKNSDDVIDVEPVEDKKSSIEDILG